jgi:hypothetical protein
MKTYAEWKGILTDYLQRYDLVDEEMVEHFINTMPPATYRSRVIQMGEPYSHTPSGRATYLTLTKWENGWRYEGPMPKL